MAHKLLFIWYKRSKGILEGGGKCSQRNYEMICHTIGEKNVSSFYIHDEYKPKSLWGYVCGAFWFLFSYYYGLSPKRVREIVRLAEAYDYVFIDRSVFGIIAKELRASGYKGKIIIHFHNVEYLYFRAKLSRYLPFRQLIIRTADSNDRWACQYADKRIALNTRDADLLGERYHCTIDACVPIALPDALAGAPALITQPALTRREPLCLFLGTYFPPNNEGILWFVENVLPYVHIRMQVVGKGMAKLKAENPILRDIEVVSDAPDLRPYLEEADIMVLPIFSGSGMKVKTCESLMHGKNIIGTSEAFEGYRGDYRQIGGLCNTAQDFIDCIRSFEQQPRPRFNTYSRNLYLQTYSYNAVKSLFKDLLNAF